MQLAVREEKNIYEIQSQGALSQCILCEYKFE
jgi:hypothetical protein